MNVNFNYEPAFYILSRRRAPCYVEGTCKFEAKSQNSGPNQLISSQMKLIQPLNSKFFSSSFSPNYSGTPIPIGIDDHLFRDPKTFSSSQ